MYKTKCGGTICVPSCIAMHLAAHPGIFPLLREACRRVRLPTGGQELRTAVDFGRVVGPSGCIRTKSITMTTPTYFAQRLGRPKPSRVVIEKTIGPNVKTVVLIATRRERYYELVTAYIGTLAPKEPWDPTLSTEAERADSLAFWTSHALVYNSTIMGMPFMSTWAEVLK